MIKLNILVINQKLNWGYFKKYIKYISDERMFKINKYYYEKDKIVSLLTELLLRFLLISDFGIKNKDIIFQYGKNGKPCCNIKNLNFSISHSGNVTSIVLGNNPLGLDLEIVKKVDLNLAKRFFNSKEYKQVIQSKNIYEEFFKIWTQKEALVKLMNKKLLDFLILKKSVISKQVIFYKINFKNIIISIATKNKCSHLNIYFVPLSKLLIFFDNL